MKVLHVIPSYEPAWSFGGTVTATSNLCRALARQGVDVTVYTTDTDGKGSHLNVPLNEPVDLGGVKVWYFRCDLGVKKAFYSKGLATKLKTTIKGFDLIHASAIWQWMQIDVYKACKNFLKPYIISPHGSFSPWPWSQNSLRKKFYWQFFGKKTITNSFAIHFTTEDERNKSFSNVAILSKIPSFIVPNGLDIDIIKKRKNIREMFHIPSNKFILLYIGRIHKIKGIHFVLEALKKLNDERFVFMVVGNKEDIIYMNYLTELSKDLIKDTIIWCDQVNPEEVWDYYYTANLFVLPSYHENFGMVVVEAMACGLPVLISKNVAIWQEVQADSAGFVVNQDAVEIANILKKLSEDPNVLNHMSENARKSVENRYDINKVASLMIKTYEDVLTGRRSPE